MGAMVWTEQETETLRSLMQKGLSISSIARSLGFPYSRTRDKIRSLKDPVKVAAAAQVKREAVHYRDRGNRRAHIERRCLCCGHKFIADSPYLRLCPTHRASAW